jgi:asparagine synthase (glutamine-hydrolysing)
MCGIAGFVGVADSSVAPGARLQSMCDAMVHRGPDDAGVVVDGRVALGMRRLSIIDLDGGHQPISNEDGSVRVVFNGEIYNYREL